MGKYAAPAASIPAAVWDRLARYAKSWLAAAIIALTYLTAVMTADETFADISTQEWLTCALFVLGGGGGVAALPNKAKKTAEPGGR